MSYNLLNYGLPYSTCSISNNDMDVKDQHLRTVFAYVQPDILAVCEMISQNSNAQRLLDSVINHTGPRTFAKASLTNFSGGDLANMIYYDPEKLVLQSQDAVITSIRDINLYHFYLNSPDLPLTHDTVRFLAIVAHLKAGSGANNEQDRAVMTSTLMNYLGAQGQQGNLLISGDFNLYTSTEQAYQNLISNSNPDIRFYDPIDQPGDWNSNSTFSGIHTQSTHVSSNGCAAGGGMDDRFDFILLSHAMMQGTDRIQGIVSSYKALGQDSLHFNQSVNSPPQNQAVPANVADALFGISDHLPVIMDFLVTDPASVSQVQTDPYRINLNNPVTDKLVLTFKQAPDYLKIELNDLSGSQVIAPLVLDHPGSSIVISVSSLKSGIYIIRFSDRGKNSITKKLVKI